MSSKWWRFGQDGGKPPAAWAERVEADVAASAPKATAQSEAIPAELTGEALEAFRAAFAASVVPFPEVRQAEGQEPQRSESVREYLLRTPHEFEADQGSRVQPRPCACGKWDGSAIHHGETLMNTRGYLDGIRREMEAGPDEEPAEAETTPVRARFDRDARLPETSAAEALPDRVLGYNVATPRTLRAGGWLASADIMSLEEAKHVRKVTGGTLVEIRAVKR